MQLCPISCSADTTSYNYDYFPLPNGQKLHVRYSLRLWQAGLATVLLIGVGVAGGYLIFLRGMSSPLDNFQKLNTISVVATTDLPPSLPDSSTPRNQTEYAVVSSLYTDSYSSAITTLGYSLKSVNVTARMILLYIPNRLSQRTICLATAAGWTLHPVPFIPPPHNGKGLYKHFEDQYTKLNLWKLDSLDIKSLVYLDADTLVRKNFDELFALPFNFAAVPDVFKDNRGFTIGFNAGVLFLRPNSTVFDDMLSKLETAEYPPKFAEQAFLNIYFGAQVVRLPYTYNANLATKQRSPTLWGALTDDMRIVHYTLEKPFPTKSLGPQELDEFFDERRNLDDGLWKDEMGWWQASWSRMMTEMQDSFSRCT